MLEELREYRKVFEAELVKAQAQVEVVDYMIAQEEKKIAERDTQYVAFGNEVAEQPTDESY